jgi:hypothetical protein
MPKIDPYKCMMCGGFKLERPDRLPFCSACEKKIVKETARVRPDVVDKSGGKLTSAAAR